MQNHARNYLKEVVQRMYATTSTLHRRFSTFVGIDLGGARGKTTAVARLTCAPSPDEAGALVQEVSTRRGAEPWNDAALIEYVAGLGSEVAIAINAPLTVPACLRCQLAACPGKDVCVDPAVIWLRTEGAELVAQAAESDRDRMAAMPGAPGGQLRNEHAGGVRLRLEPYVHRGAELKMHYERGLLPRDCMGVGTGPIAARAGHLRRMLHGMGFVLNQSLIEVSPRATVHALFGPRKARGYKRDADPWQTRVAIIEGMHDLSFAPRSRLAREEVLRNDHCFDALLSGYTAFLWARDGWAMPEGLFAEDGWIWAPP